MTDFGVKNIWQPATGPYMATIITGYFSASSSAFAAWSRNNYTFNDDLHWTKGSHNFAFGGHIELSKFNVTNVYQSYGAFGFNTNTAESQRDGQLPDGLHDQLHPGELRAGQRPQPLPRTLRPG